MKKAVYSILLMLLPLMASADAVEIDGIYYNLISDVRTAEVTKNPDKYSGNIIIPNSVNYEGVEYCVTTIGKWAFDFCSDLTSVTIPNSVTEMNDGAFMGCNGLTSVQISDLDAWFKIQFSSYESNPLYYAHHLFLNGTEVKDLVIPNSVTCIERCTFTNCSGLTSVTIHNGVTEIRDMAFSGCDGLTAVHISDLDAWYRIQFISNPLVCAHHLYLNGTEIKDLVIPNSITSIGRSTFSGCSGLTSVTIPNGIKYINYFAFSGCSSLTSLTIPNGVTDIGMGAFEGCSSLTSLSIPNSVSYIGIWAFDNCSNLTSLIIPNSVTCIDGYAFCGCPLTNVYCYANKVPSTSNPNGGTVFEESYILNATLHVPEESIELYKVAKYWDHFKNYVALSESNIKYNLTYMVDGEVYKTYELSEGDVIAPEPAPTKEGYTFSGWSDIPATMPAHDVTITGSFTKNEVVFYTLTYMVDGEVYKTYSLAEGTTISPEPAPTKEGYTFSGWSDLPATMPAHDVTVTGSFAKSTYKLKYKVDDELYKEYYYEYGATITPEPEPTREGYTFSGWSEIPKTMPAHKVTVYGYFTKNEEPSITQDHVVYQIDGGTVTVTQADDASGDIKIEASVVINDKTYEVTVIAKAVFEGCTGITSLEIPNTITTVGEKAFDGCTGLSLIIIGTGIKEIGRKAFANIFKQNARTRGDEDGLHFYCEAESVPNTSSEAFVETDLANATLHVPDNMVEAYKLVTPWNEFGNIVGLSDTGIKVISIDKPDALVFDMLGNRRDNIRQGINIIHTKDGKTKKVIVNNH